MRSFASLHALCASSARAAVVGIVCAAIGSVACAQTASVTLTGATLTQWGYTPASKVIDLKGRGITVIDPNAFKGYAAVEALVLDDNKLTSLGLPLRPLNGLKRLSAARNTISSVDGSTFRTMPNLVSINLSNNQINLLDANVFDNHNVLDTVDLRNNRIESVETGLMQNLPSLKKVYVGGNPVTQRFGVSNLQVMLCATNPACIVLE